MKQPNILFIMTDQFHADCLSAFGHPDVRTPNLDQLVHGGTAFRNCYSNSAICLPSRLSFLTGQYIHTHGIMANHRTAELRSPCRPLASHLKETLGYATGAIGKLHLGSLEQKAGFDEIVYTEAPPGEENHYFEYLRSHGLLEEYEKFQVKKPEVLQRFTAGDSRIPTRHSNENFTADQTMRFIEECGERPFFCWTTFERPHPPLYVPTDFDVKYDPDALQLPGYAGPSFQSRPFAKRPGVENIWSAQALGEKTLRYALARYYGLISLIDFNVGRLVEFLRERGQLENTIIIFTSDHGDFAGQYGLLGKNTPSVDCLYRVPYLWHWPGQFARDQVFGLTETIDLYPTLCDLLGIDTPASVQGTSHENGLSGDELFEGREAVFFETTTVKTVRTRRYKLSLRVDDQVTGELHDMARDPLEANDLFDMPSHAHVQKELTEKLLGWLVRSAMPSSIHRGVDKIPPTWRWHQSLPSRRIGV